MGKLPLQGGALVGSRAPGCRCWCFSLAVGSGLGRRDLIRGCQISQWGQSWSLGSEWGQNLNGKLSKGRPGHQASQGRDYGHANYSRSPCRLLTLLTPGSPGGWRFLPSPRGHQQEGSRGQGMMGGVCFPDFGGESRKALLKIAGGVGEGEHDNP